MNATYQAVAISLLLFPGYIARWIYSNIRYRQNVSDFQAFIEMVVWTAIVSALFGLTGETFGLVSFSDQSAPILYLEPNTWLFAKLVAYSVILPGFIALLIERGVIHSVIRWLTKQDMTSKQSMWEKFFSENNKYVFVHFKDGRVVFGFPGKYSKDPSEGMFVVSNSRWAKRSEDGRIEYTKCVGGNIFIINKSEVAFIESSNYPENEKGGDSNGQKPKDSATATAQAVKSTTNTI